MLGLLLAAALVMSLFVAFGAPAHAAAAKTALSVSVSKATVASGGSSTATATLKRGKSLLKSAPVQIQKRVTGTTKWYKVATGKTDSRGRFAVTLKNATKNIDVRATYAGTKASKRSVSAVKGIKVTQKLTVTKTSTSAPVKGSAIHVNGIATSGLVGRNLVLERKSGSKWVKAGSGKVAKNKTFSLKATAGNAGIASYRATSPASKATLAASSGVKKFTVSQWFGLETLVSEYEASGALVKRLTGRELSINGKTYSNAPGGYLSSDDDRRALHYDEWNLGGKCSRFTATFGFDDDEVEGDPYAYFDVYGDGQKPIESDFVAADEYYSIDAKLNKTKSFLLQMYFAFDEEGPDDGWGAAAFGNARVLCSARP